MRHANLLSALAIMAFTALPCLAADQPAAIPQAQPQSPWGISSSAEWFNTHTKFDPLMVQAGTRWIRAFPEWNSVEPKRGEFDWKTSDAWVADFQKDHLAILATLCYLPTWNSADGGTRKFPMKDPQAFNEYCHAAMSRYKNSIQHWEVGNELNGSFGPGCTPALYADMTTRAYTEAKKVDKNIMVGMSVANFDVNYLDQAIKSGAADHFDFICVHPYENVGTLAGGGEMGYLSLAGNLRDMLKANHQNVDTPLWITEFGYSVPVRPDAKADALQADVMTKAHVLALAQGFSHLFWFEPRGPSYGHGTDLGLIREDWSQRPSYHAYAAMTAQLGEVPHYVGWLNVAKGGFGFVFDGPKGGVLVTWAPADTHLNATFTADVHVIDEAGKSSDLATGKGVALTTSPVYITGIPSTLEDQAKANLGKPYPWGVDYSKATAVTCRLGASNIDKGLKQANPNTTAVVIQGDDSCRRTNFSVGGEGHYIYFRVDPQFVPYGTKKLAITITAKRIAPDKDAGMNLSYESTAGYHNVPNVWWTIPADNNWHTYTWNVTDANFVGQWGWNFRIDASGSHNEFLIKQMEVAKPATGK